MIDITRIYTKTMHKALQNAVKKGFRLDYEPKGNFIRFLYNTKQGVVIKFNTVITCITGINANYYLKLEYDQLINDLEKIYEQLKNNNPCRLKNN